MTNAKTRLLEKLVRDWVAELEAEGHDANDLQEFADAYTDNTPEEEQSEEELNDYLAGYGE